MAKDRLEPCPERPGIGRARDLESSYRVLDGRVIIEIELDELQQIFNTFDPSPFHKRDIDDDAEEYIVGAARDIAMKRPLSLVVYLPPEKAARERSDLLEVAIRNYFDYRAKAARRELRVIFRRGWDSLLVGSLFLFACVSLQGLVPLLIRREVLVQFLREGLIICGWVAMWGPIHVFLYEWRPYRAMLSVYDKLRVMPVTILPAPHTG